MEVPPEAPQRIHTDAARESTGPFESQLSEVVQELKELKLDIRSRFNEAVGASLAIQARRSPNAASSSHHERELFIPHPSLSRMLSTFLGDLSAKFKTPEQAEALEYVIAGDSHLLLVGPTAMGKSLVYMLPAAQHDSGITCVLLPLSALHLDFDRRCRDLNIASSRWQPVINEKPQTRIVYVSPEHAQTSIFTNYLIEMSLLGQLTRVVIDEAHLATLHSDFRFCFSALQPLVTAGESSSFRLTMIGTISTSSRCSLLADDGHLPTIPPIGTLVSFWDRRLSRYPRSHGPPRNLAIGNDVSTVLLGCLYEILG